MKLAGWGRFPTTTADLIEPAGNDAAVKTVMAHNKLIGRGCGRSYGDAALADTVLGSRHLDHFLDFDTEAGTLHCAAGLSLDAILKITMAKHYILPVLPGTRFVSVGGAIAADIHGKNHHRDGCFSEYVLGFNLLLASGEIVHCSREENPELFAATCGGMGLTGIILDAQLKLHKVPGVLIHNRSIATSNLAECLAKLDEHSNSHYAVAWIDCLARGEALGRSVIYLGEHVEARNKTGPYRHRSSALLTVPFSTPGFLLNSLTMRSFNNLYYSLQSRRNSENLVHYQRYFFPLDRIQHWNRLYGHRGFQQYQLVLPTPTAQDGLKKILKRVADSGMGSFLAVLKQLGPANDNPLSFPLAGFTLTLDFKMHAGLEELLRQLDAIVLEHQGRLYLAKDARMNRDMFRAGYPDWEEFMAVKDKVDPTGRFSSLLSQRLGLESGQREYRAIEQGDQLA